MDLSKNEFKVTLFGYDRAQVDELHKKALAAFEALQADKVRLQDEVDSLHKDIETYRRDGRFVQEALVTAQRTADEIRIAAQKHADLIVDDARSAAQAEREVAAQQVADSHLEIDRLRQDRKRFIEDFGLLLERYQRELHMVVHTEPMEIGPA